MANSARQRIAEGAQVIDLSRSPTTFFNADEQRADKQARDPPFSLSLPTRA